MKRIVRFLVYGLFFLFFWPFFVYSKRGQKPEKKITSTIIVANHYSDFDPFFIFLIYGFKNKLRFVTYEGVKKNPFTHLLCWAFDCIYVSNDVAKDVSSVRESIKALSKGDNIVIFPEGVINPTKNGFFEFSRSFCFMSRVTNADVIPHFIYPRVGLFKKTYVYIGQKITSKEIKNIGDDEIAATKILSKVMDYRQSIEGEINEKN